MTSPEHCSPLVSAVYLDARNTATHESPRSGYSGPGYRGPACKTVIKKMGQPNSLPQVGMKRYLKELRTLRLPFTMERRVVSFLHAKRAKPKSLVAGGIATVFIFSALLTTAQNQHPRKPEVFVLGTLYNRHETVSGYDLKALLKAIAAIDPDVVVLDVNPKELREQRVSPGKVEYTRVIFPYINAHRLRAYPGEPGEPMFTEIVTAVAGLRKDLTEKDPERLATMKRFRTATYDAMAQLWTNPAVANSETTEKVIVGLKAYEAEILGPLEIESHERWDRYAAMMVLRAVRENPGKRILQLTGIENCPRIRSELRTTNRIKLIDMEEWLRRNLQ